MADKPHVVCIPSPAQSHIKAMLKLAQLLHQRGFHITFVNTDFIHNRFLQTQGPSSLDGLPDFRFETIPDGLPPPSDADHAATRDIPSIIESERKRLLSPFSDLLKKLNDTSISNTTPPVTRIVSDGYMPFTIAAGEESGIPVVLFFTIPACAFMAIKQLPALTEKFSLPPRKGEKTSSDMVSSFCSFRNVHDHILFDFNMEVADRANKASAVVFQTFYDLEKHVLDALSSIHRPVFAIGPLQLLLDHIPEHPLNLFKYSLWKEESECLQWLDSKPPNSVVYVNFGSITVMTQKQLVEFSMGLAKSKHFFLWVIRPDLVVGESAVLPPEFAEKIKEKGLVAGWCPQEEVLNHPSIGGFLTHSGWNSTIESLSSGVPMLCWPFLGDQTTNCRYACKEWGIGMEIDNDIKREEVEKLVRELMDGEKGKEMKKNVMEWKRLAHEATAPHGSSSIDLDNLVRLLLS